MVRLLLTVCLLALVSACYSARNIPYMFRAHIPYPVNYLDRLERLQGWPVEQGDGLNCSGFVSNAHSAPFRTAADIYQNRLQDLSFVVEFKNIREMEQMEQYIQPGALASFEGPRTSNPKQAHGVHVAAYLGNGIWTDADFRRGDVNKFRLHDKLMSDAFFTGRVRLYEWAQPEKFSFTNAYNTLGRDDAN